MRRQPELCLSVACLLRALPFGDGLANYQHSQKGRSRDDEVIQTRMTSTKGIGKPKDCRMCVSNPVACRDTPAHKQLHLKQMPLTGA